MNTLYLQHKKRFHLVGFVAVLALVSVFSLRFFNQSDAQTPPNTISMHNVRGFAWSSNIGWISLNREDCDANNDGNFGDPAPGVLQCPTTGTAFDYGVSIDPITGAFSGYAWSQVGWISFYGSDTASCGGVSPNVNLATGSPATGYKVSGFARALSGNTPGSGGWDGCIALSDTSKFISPNTSGTGGVTYLPPAAPGAKGKLVGFAWGSDVVGWTDFNGASVDLLKPFVDLQITDQYTIAKSPAISYTSAPTYPIKPTLHYASTNVVAPCTTTATNNDTKWVNAGILPNLFGTKTVSNITSGGTYTYTLDCMGNDGKHYKSSAVISIITGAPSVKLEVGPSSSTSKSNIYQAPATGTFIPKVYWTLFNIKPGSCTVPHTSSPTNAKWNSSAISGNSGNVTVTSISSFQMNVNHSFSMTCTGIDGKPYYDTALIDFGANPTVSILADGNSGISKVVSGASSAISWTPSNAATCEIGPGNDGIWPSGVLLGSVDTAAVGTPINLAVKQSFASKPITAKKTFSILCRDSNNQSATDFVVVDLLQVPACTLAAIGSSLNIKADDGTATSTASGLSLLGSGGYTSGTANITVSVAPALISLLSGQVSPISVVRGAGSGSVFVQASGAGVPSGTYANGVTITAKDSSGTPMCSDSIDVVASKSIQLMCPNTGLPPPCTSWCQAHPTDPICKPIKQPKFEEI